MAEGEYQRGDMDIRDQQQTFVGFMKVSVWSSAITIVSVLFLTLLFATSWNWWQSLLATLVVGVAGGMMVRLPGAWYGVLFVLSGVVAVTVGIISLLMALVGS